MKVVEALTQIDNSVKQVGADLDEGFTEVGTLIGQLKDGDTTPEQDTIISSITTRLGTMATTAKSLADIVPNTPPVEGG